jgi:hypothetical protein
VLYRQDFLRSAAKAVAAAVALPGYGGMKNSFATERPRQTKIADLAVVRLREKGSKGQPRAFLEITTNSDLNGVSGESFMDTPRQLAQILL